jgi:hypothetical protein
LFADFGEIYMTLNLSPDTHLQSDSTPETVTIIGLFEDVIDARSAFRALRKAGCTPDCVSFIVRDRKADEGSPAARHGAVARAIEEADLNGHSDWLLGLASLIVPERGTFLVAGMLGAALANATLDSNREELPASVLAMTMEKFGFSADEVTYLESRILADAMLIALTTDDQDRLASARDLLSENNAVHLGATRTDEDVAVSARRLLESPPEIYGSSDVVVTDAVAPLLALVRGQASAEWARSMKGRLVVDSDGAETGRIDDLIAEPSAENGESVVQDQIRYVVVTFGGVLGLGRRRAAIPIDQVTLDNDPVRINIVRDILRHAPPFDPAAPFSRREEQAIYAYFGRPPYWD